MSRKSVPSYRLHRQSGQAVVTLADPGNGNRRDYLLGRYGSAASKAEYRRILAEQETAQGRLPPKRGEAGCADITLNELMLAYVRHAATYYIKNGEPTSETETIKLALRFLKPWGATLAREFGPLALRAARDAMLAHPVTRRIKVKDKATGKTRQETKIIAAGLSRGTINRQIARIKGMFKWGAGQELIPIEAYHRLACVEGLRRGKTPARERPRIKPVADADIAAALVHLPPIVADMVRLQRLTGARPAEVCQLRAVDIDRAGEVWEYRPDRHKTEHCDRERVIFLGPQARTIITKYLHLDMTAPLFRPDQSEADRAAKLRQDRKTPLWPSHLQAQERKKRRRPRRVLHDQYDVPAYRRAIARACQKAGIPQWSPHRLRHTAATEIRKVFGLECAQAVLGHAALGVTQVYAEKDMEAAKRVMAKIG